MLRVLDLFSGAGGFSMALQRILNTRTVGYCDISPDSRELLADLQRRGLLQEAHIFADMKKLKASELPQADMVTSGFPCQDLSTVGPRTGLFEGKRSSLFKQILRLVKSLRPSYVFLENSPAIANDPRYRDFCELWLRLGYDLAWSFFTAQEVGAAITRRRWYMLARRRREPKPLNLRPQSKTCKHLSHDIKHEPRHHAIAKWASGLMGNAVVPCVV